MPRRGLNTILFILLRLHRKLKELIYAFSKARMLARSVTILPHVYNTSSDHNRIFFFFSKGALERARFLCPFFSDI